MSETLYSIAIGAFNESLKIIMIIFVLMIIVELLVLRYRNKIISLMNRNKYLNYVLSSFLGSVPGCVGTFTADSLYMSGLAGFGSIVAVMVATFGDETFLMLSMAAAGKIPLDIVIILVASLFVLGIAAGAIADKLQHRFGLKFAARCRIHHHEEEEFKPMHFIKEHVYGHIIKKHLSRIFIWLFVAVFIIELMQGYIDPDTLLAGQNLYIILIGAAMIGLLPISGPNIFFIVMFAEGYIPFSILLANSIVQDGHGSLPILGFSLDDFLKIKAFNLLFGLVIGLVLLMVGL